MIQKIDTNSQEYKEELTNTVKFTDKVLERFDFVYNDNEEVNEAIQMGLTRNKLIYGKRYCPCFMVIGETKEEQKAANNRLCPCKPALEKEIPETGSCHCGIFNTKTSAHDMSEEDLEERIDEMKHSQGLSKEDCEKLLLKQEISAQELQDLLEARNIGLIDFQLIDNREWMEWVSQRIVGTDYLVPTTAFYQALENVKDKEKSTVVYCLSGSRSAYCQKVMLDLGFKSVCNLDYGISSYRGEMTSGEE